MSRVIGWMFVGVRVNQGAVVYTIGVVLARLGKSSQLGALALPLGNQYRALNKS